MVGHENFYSGISDSEHEATQLILSLARDTAFNTPSVREIEKADAVVVVGEDITNVAPRIALALRQSVRNKAKELAEGSNIPAWQDAAVKELAQNDRSPLAILSSYATRLDDVASDVVIDSPSELISIGSAIASSISDKAPSANSNEDTVSRIADQLVNAKRPLVIAGSSVGNIGLIKVAANIARALNDKRNEAIDLCLVVPGVNTIGMSMLVNSHNTLGVALDKLQSGAASKVIVLENDLYHHASHTAVDEALDKADGVLVIDQIPTRTTAKASTLLPSTSFSEHEATYVNYEGRAQLSFQVHRNHTAAIPAWRWLSEQQRGDIDALINRCAQEVANFEKLGVLLPDLNEFVASMKIPRQSHRYSGRTAMKANLNVHEPKQPVDDQSVMSFSMEGIPVTSDIPVLGAAWAPAWNSNQSISKFQDEINGELKQGHIGELLIERNESGDYLDIATPNVSSNGLQLAIAYQIFGSDELSAKASTIQQRMTDAYVAISPSDARSLGLNQGDEVSIDGNGHVAVASIRSKIKEGTAAVYCGDNDIDRHALGATIALSKTAGANLNRGIKGLIVSDLYEESY